MKHIFRYTIVLFSFTLLIACAKTEVNKATVQVYFDLESYVDRIIEKEVTIPNVKKTVRLNGKEETKELNNYDLSPEIKMLKKYNINKVSLSGKYDVKTSQNEGFEKVEYIANEEDLKTRNISIWKKGDEIQKIEILAVQTSIMATSNQKIVYEPNKSFQLVSEDNNKYSNDLMKEILITLNH